MSIKDFLTRKKPQITGRRQFLGKTEGFKDKTDRAFNQRMLKAYLDGHKMFAFGTRKTISGIEKAYWPVLQRP